MLFKQPNKFTMKLSTKCLATLIVIIIAIQSVFTASTEQRVAFGQPDALVGRLLGPNEGGNHHHLARLLKRSAQAARLLDPMPWEDGYFDPSYHTWPKSRQAQVGSKHSIKLVADNDSAGVDKSD